MGVTFISPFCCILKCFHDNLLTFCYFMLSQRSGDNQLHESLHLPWTHRFSRSSHKRPWTTKATLRKKGWTRKETLRKERQKSGSLISDNTTKLWSLPGMVLTQKQTQKAVEQKTKPWADNLSSPSACFSSLSPLNTYLVVEATKDPELPKQPWERRAESPKQPSERSLRNQAPWFQTTLQS